MRDVDLGRDDVPATQRDIGLAGDQALHRRLREVLAGHLQHDARPLGAHRPGQPSHQPVGGHAREGDAHRTHLAVIGRRDRGPGATQRVENFLGRFDQGLARRGEPYRAGVAIEQARAQLPLQLFDRPAQRWLGDVQPLGGAAEMQLLGHRQEGPDLVDIHVHASQLFLLR